MTNPLQFPVNNGMLLLAEGQVKVMEKQMGQDNPMVEGVIWRQMLRFFFPILLGTFFQQLYNTADALIVGRILGESALAAVGGSAGIITMTVVGFFMGLTSGASIIAAQMLGAKDRQSVNDSIHTIYAFSIVAGIFLAITGIFLTEQMLLWLNTPQSLMKGSIEYLWIYFAGLVFVLIYNTGASILRSLGDAKHPFWYLIVCSIINVVLDYALIVYGHMGIAGAAAATVVAQAISAVLVTMRLRKFTEVCDFSLRKIRINGNMMKRELRLGFPGGVQSAMYCISGLITTAALNSFGEIPVAAWTAYTKFDALFWMISGAMGVTITTFVGQNFGAGKFDRIGKGVKLMNWSYVVVAVFSSIFFVLLRVPLYRIFVESEEAVTIGCRMLMLITPFYILNIFIENYSGALRGMGDTVAPMMISIFGVCVFRMIYLAILMPIYGSLDILCIMYPVSWALTNLMYYFYYNARMRKLVKG